MASLDGSKYCHICEGEVTEEDLRRELDCSYVNCPGRAYHEDCLGVYLKKNKVPVDRLIGYPCPAKLDNGRACTGSVVKTHHKYPSNNKKKQKRIEAAAAAAAAARQKPQPVAKPKAVAVATAAVKGVDVAKARIMPTSMSNNVSSYSTLKTNAALVKAAANPLSAATAISNNAKMEPERVVRQRNIPGLTGPIKPMSNLDIQRQMVAEARAALRAEGKLQGKGAGITEPGKGAKAAGAAGASAAGAAGSKGNLRTTSSQLSLEGSDDLRSEGSSSFVAGAGAGGFGADWAAAEAPSIDLNQLQDAFPALPASSTPRNTSASANAASPGSPDAAAAVAAAPADLDEADPVVGHDLVYATDDGMAVVQDAAGNFLLLEDVYGAAPELVGFADEEGNVSYYVVVRQSFITAQEAAVAAMAAAAATPSPEPGASGMGTPLGSEANLGAAAASVAPVPQQHELQPDLAAGFGAAGLLAGVANAAAAVPAALAVPVPQAPAVDASAYQQPAYYVQAEQQQQEQQPAEEEDDLDDLLALCGVGGSGGDTSSASAVPAPMPIPIPDPVPAYSAAPYAAGGGYAMYGQAAAQQQPLYGATQYGGYPYGGQQYGAVAGADSSSEVASMMHMLQVGV